MNSIHPSVPLDFRNGDSPYHVEIAQYIQVLYDRLEVWRVVVWVGFAIKDKHRIRICGTNSICGATAAMVEIAASDTSVVEVVLLAVLASVTLLSLVATYSL